jgi:hypothetical protein
VCHRHRREDEAKSICESHGNNLFKSDSSTASDAAYKCETTTSDWSCCAIVYTCIRSIVAEEGFECQSDCVCVGKDQV